MKKAFAALSMLLMLICATAALADQRDFVIVNDTGYPIKFIGINLPGDNIWNENEIRSVLEDRDSIHVKFRPTDSKGCVWNIKVTWADDNSSQIFHDLNLCKINRVTLKYNRNTDIATYTTD